MCSLASYDENLNMAETGLIFQIDNLAVLITIILTQHQRGVGSSLHGKLWLKKRPRPEPFNFAKFHDYMR